jgi:threonine dehydrogenase-like Zn-dependent dehydrogenase
MRAAALIEPGTVKIERVPLPEPEPGEVRVRLEGCGVCASNLVPWSGPRWMKFPTVPGSLGHEGWGRIDAIGDEVEGFALGDRVAVLFQHSYAEWDVGPAELVVRIPEELGNAPFPGEPLGCAMNIFERSDIRTGQVVAIVGIGFLGAALTQLASHAGASVIAISGRPFALEMARRMGAATTFSLADAVAARDEVRGVTGGRLCERVIEATGKQAPLDLASELVAERGRLVIAGYHQDGLRTVNMQQWNWKGIDVVNAHERDPLIYAAGVRRAIEAIRQGQLTPLPLFTHTFPLERLGEALDAARDRPPGFLKALVTFS